LAIQVLNPAPGLATATATTDGNGSCWVGGLARGSYPVRVTPPAGWTPLSPDPAQLSLIASQNAYLDFTFAARSSGGGGSQGGGGGQRPPEPPPHREVIARLVAVKVRKKRRLVVQVRYADTGALKEQFLSPFQPPAFKGIQVAVLRGNSARVPDRVTLTARKGHKTVTASFFV
jgi:hypothetical protein